MDELIEHMKVCGWSEVPYGAGFIIVGPDGQNFNEWSDALRACIEVASGK